MNIGEEVIVDIQAIAHGGHCVARHDGRVIFVRHAIPGEKAKIKITGVSKNFARADVVEVIEISADRVVPKCKFALNKKLEHRMSEKNCLFKSYLSATICIFPSFILANKSLYPLNLYEGAL